MRWLFSLIASLALILVTAWLVGFIWFIGEVPRHSLEAKAKTKSDIGVVLTGAQGRIMHGLIALYEGRVANLYISGVNEDITDQQLFSSLGTPLGTKLYNQLQSKINIGREARSTRGNALEVQKFLKENKQHKTILLITTNYHIPRSLHEFNRTLPDYTIIAEPVFSPKFPPEWWKNKDSGMLLVTEYHKFLISYGINFVAQETHLSEILANNPL